MANIQSHRPTGIISPKAGKDLIITSGPKNQNLSYNSETGCEIKFKSNDKWHARESISFKQGQNWPATAMNAVSQGKLRAMEERWG